MSDFPSPPNFTASPSPANFTVIVVVAAILSVVGLAVIFGILYYCAKRARGGIVRESQVALAPLASNRTRVWEIEAPTMERFLQEAAGEKPVRFTAQQLNGFTRNYSTTLGAGGFGVVYEGQLPNGVKIAVKVLNRSLRRTAEEQFMAEIETIGRTHHRNLVRLYGFCNDQLISALVYEYMENKSLDKYLFIKKYQIEWKILHDIAIGAAKGIAYLHEECEPRIIHYDIKPANILIDANFVPKVADFGLARLCNKDNTHISISEYRGTPGYSAPEFILKNYPITFKCDVYSFGMVLFEIVGRRRNARVSPSDSFDWFPKHVWEAHEQNELPAITLSLGIKEKDREKAVRMCMVALWCVQDSPEDRPPMSTVVKMLEGGEEIMPPPRPFQFLYSSQGDTLELSGTSISLNQSTSGGSRSYWYKESTPIMTKHV